MKNPITVLKSTHTTVDLQELLTPGVEWDGHSNHMPVPYYEITQDEYIHAVSGTTPEYEWRQLITDISDEPIALTLQVKKFHNNLYAVAMPTQWRCATNEEKANGGYGIIYTAPIRYFKIGCEHKYQSQTVGRCLNRHTCSICGHSFVVDSSD